LRKRKRKKTVAMARVTLPVLVGPNERWFVDFDTDSIVTGRWFRALASVGYYSRERPAINVDTSLGGCRVAGLPDRLADIRGLPEVITIDNGPEFTRKFLDEWAYRRVVRLNFIRSPMTTEQTRASGYLDKFTCKYI
jgi:putative transposase